MSTPSLPSVSPTADIDLFGEKHTLKFTFRAFEELGVNPFDRESVKQFESAPKTLRDLAQQIRAGLLHEYYGRKAVRGGEDCPSIEEVMNELDPIKYVELLIAIQGIKGEQKEEPQEDEGGAKQNPPAA